jgi:hypothetical protein
VRAVAGIAQRLALTIALEDEDHLLVPGMDVVAHDAARIQGRGAHG